jgi:hypothetical protein
LRRQRCIPVATRYELQMQWSAPDMNGKTLLKILFSGIFLTLLAATAFASHKQPIWHYTGLTLGANRFWNFATFLDAYGGFTTFYVWVFYKEVRWVRRALWFIAIMLLGNMAMSTYMLLQLWRLRADQPVSDLLLRAPAPAT